MKNYGKAVGYFFLLIGVMSLIGFLWGLLESKKFTFDFIGGLISIVIGRGLLKNRNSSRTAAIILCGLSVIGSIVWLVKETINGDGLKTVSAFNYFEVPTAIFVAISLVSFGIALFCLLHPNTRKYYVFIDKDAPLPLRKSNLVTVLIANDSAEILVAKSLLRSENIPSFAKGAAVQDFFAMGRIGTGFNLLTGPVELQVISDNAIQAQEILNDMINESTAEESDISSLKTTGGDLHE